MLKYFSVVLAAFVVAGCGSVPTKAPVANAPVAVVAQTTHVKCESLLQKGCWESRALNFEWNPSLEVTKGLDTPATSQAEQQARVQTMPPKAWDAYLKGDLKAAGPRTYRYYFFKELSAVPAENVQTYQISGKNVVTKVAMRDVTDKVSYPDFELGAPIKVYEVQTAGSDPVGVSIQFPWSMIMEKTYLLICADDTRGVYPSGKINPQNGTHKGHLITPEQFKWLRDKGSKRGLSPFFSADSAEKK